MFNLKKNYMQFYTKIDGSMEQNIKILYFEEGVFFRFTYLDIYSIFSIIFLKNFKPCLNFLSLTKTIRLKKK